MPLLCIQEKRPADLASNNAETNRNDIFAAGRRGSLDWSASSCSGLSADGWDWILRRGVLSHTAGFGPSSRWVQPIAINTCFVFFQGKEREGGRERKGENRREVKMVHRHLALPTGLDFYPALEENFKREWGVQAKIEAYGNKKKLNQFLQVGLRRNTGPGKGKWLGRDSKGQGVSISTAVSVWRASPLLKMESAFF